MSSFSTRPAPAHKAERRLAGAAITLLVHAALVLGWQMARTPPPSQAEGASLDVQWIRLPPPARRFGIAPVTPPAKATRRPAAARSTGVVAAAPPADPAPGGATADPGPAPAAEPLPAPAGSFLERARRSAGGIDRALRKENRPLIVAPPDSPQLRMREGMEQAHALAPPRLWEAPKVEELVNNTGDGARRTRVITGNRTYCITERSPATNIDMIEMHGKTRLTNCPEHETPAKRQQWRTARD